MEEIIQHCKAIEAQNNAILVRQSSIGGMLLVLGASQGGKVREICDKCCKDMEESLDKFYTKPLREMLGESDG